jgi:hypothetical protein
MPATTPRPPSSEQVAAFDRNAWSRSIGIPGRNPRNPHEIVLIDLPLWVHFALAAERQAHWHQEHMRPAGMDARPPTMALFRTMWEVDQNWMPAIRELCRKSEQAKKLTRLCNLEELNAYSLQIDLPQE